MTGAGVSLPPLVARQILRGVGLTGPVAVTTVREHNHVYRIHAAGDVFYLKTHTKHWYAGNVDAPRRCVDHERAAWSVLEAHGIPVPEVVLAERGSDNPLGRPFILTRALAGAPLTEHLAPGGGAREIPAPLRAAGDYLRRMHAIRFDWPGYIMSPAGPAAPPAAGAWQHRCWTAAARQAHAQATLETHASAPPPPLVRRLEAAYAGIEEALRAAYEPPRFVHGDCHAHQFYLAPDGQSWRVTGVVDMEVASAGDPGEDLIKFGIEVATILPAHTRWWEPLFAGYGGEPHFGLFRLRLLAASPAEFAWVRPPKQRRSWQEVVVHLLAARNWGELFDGGW